MKHLIQFLEYHQRRAEVKTSGTKDTFETGAQRDTQQGKLRFDLIHPTMDEALAEVLGSGAVRYGEGNWEKGMPYSRVYASIRRHLHSWWTGQTDEDHLAHLACNVMFLIAYERQLRTGTDDRPYTQTPDLPIQDRRGDRNPPDDLDAAPSAKCGSLKWAIKYGSLEWAIQRMKEGRVLVFEGYPSLKHAWLEASGPREAGVYFYAENLYDPDDAKLDPILTACAAGTASAEGREHYATGWEEAE